MSSIMLSDTNFLVNLVLTGGEKALEAYKSLGGKIINDLDGDGIETTERGARAVYFDVDADRFAERTGWLGGDDGFLVRDLNGNGRIDAISEMFGGAGASGLGQLAAFDADNDGKITRADARRRARGGRVSRRGGWSRRGMREKSPIPLVDAMMVSRHDSVLND